MISGQKLSRCVVELRAHSESYLMGMCIEELLGFLLVLEYLHNLYVILCLLVFSGPEYLAHNETQCVFTFSDTCQCIMMVTGCMSLPR